MKLTAKQRTLIHHLRDHYHVGPNIDTHITTPDFAPDFGLSLPHDWMTWHGRRSAHDRTAPRKHNDEEADV